MPNQIFKKHMPIEMILDLLESICVKNEKHYILNNTSFKKGLYNETIPNFLIKCSEFYHNSKKTYLEKKLTYNSFITVVRQICNLNKITYTSLIKYDKSSYDIIYYIYY